MKKDIRIINSMKLIVNAYVQLLESHSNEKIKISHICKKAGVSRPTFYNNYKCKDDILIHYLTYLIKRYFEILNEKKYDDEHSVLLFFWICHKEQNFFKTLACQKMDREIIDCLKEAIIKKSAIATSHSLVSGKNHPTLATIDFQAYISASKLYASLFYWLNNPHITYKGIAKLHFANNGLIF